MMTLLTVAIALLTWALLPLTALFAHVLQDAPALPQPTLDLITLLFMTMGGAGFLKLLASKAGIKVGSWKAVGLTYVVALALIAFSVFQGWYTLPPITCGVPELVDKCFESIYQVALKVMLGANLAYVLIYEPVFNPKLPAPVAVVPASDPAAKKAVASTVGAQA